MIIKTSELNLARPYPTSLLMLLVTGSVLLLGQGFPVLPNMVEPTEKLTFGINLDLKKAITIHSNLI